MKSATPSSMSMALWQVSPPPTPMPLSKWSISSPSAMSRLATEAAETLIANGADILTGTAQMVVGPIAVAIESGARWFGTQASQAELSQDAGVAFSNLQVGCRLGRHHCKYRSGRTGWQCLFIDASKRRPGHGVRRLDPLPITIRVCRGDPLGCPASTIRTSQNR